MPVGLASGEANATLDARLSGWGWVQLHTGDPGAAGTTAVAGNSTRKAVTWASASGGSASMTSTLPSWTDPEVNTTETYTHVSFWSASTAGTFRASGTLTANQVSATGDTFAITSYSVSLTVAS